MHDAANGLLRRASELALRLATARRGIERTVNGITYRVDARCRATFTPSYDEGASALIREHVSPGGEAWNVGANVGVHTLQLCSLVGPKGRVVAFEPNPAAAALLRRNARLNGFDDRLEIIAAAVGERRGGVELYASGHDDMSRPGKPNPLLTHPRSLQVPMVTLDDVWRSRRSTPDCVIMDIEGWEVAAMSRARALLAAVRQSALLVVELHPDAWSWSGHSRAGLESILADHDLVAIPLSGQHDPLGTLGQVVLRPRGVP